MGTSNRTVREKKKMWGRMRFSKEDIRKSDSKGMEDKYTIKVIGLSYNMDSPEIIRVSQENKEMLNNPNFNYEFYTLNFELSIELPWTVDGLSPYNAEDQEKIDLNFVKQDPNDITKTVPY